MQIDKKIPIDKFGRFTQVKRDLAGIKIHKLTAIKRVRMRKGKEKSLRWYWKCLCDCGKITTILEYSFYSGATQSCGCIIKYNNCKSRGEANHNTHFYRYELGAAKRKIQFCLSRQQFDELIFKACHYCGAPPVEKSFHKNSYGSIYVNGIDRVDNNKGYTTDNCVPCCSPCNTAKKEMTVEQFFNLVKAIYNHNKMGQK